MHRQFLDRSLLLEQLGSWHLDDLALAVERCCSRKFDNNSHGNLAGWRSAWNELPALAAKLDAHTDVVRVVAETGLPLAETGRLRDTLMRFHPWRKGPLELLGVPIDTEWRSNWKWNRLAPHVELANRRVLDVGCGNGYYGWRMLAAGAQYVLGCEPFLLSLAQFEVFRKYSSDPERHWVVPLADTDLPRGMEAFDVTFSMGVLYHRPNPIEHLQILHSTLRSGGSLVLETIVLDQNTADQLAEAVLVPEDRYAKMRNVWFLPTVSMLQRWLRRTGFGNIELIDISTTTVLEQRRTPWMTFESLQDFLDPQDSSKTVEGYPAPVRAVLKAEKIRD
jgi:tRNA (mo5U34)-methyltransferase